MGEMGEMEKKFNVDRSHPKSQIGLSQPESMASSPSSSSLQRRERVVASAPAKVSFAHASTPSGRRGRRNALRASDVHFPNFLPFDHGHHSPSCALLLLLLLIFCPSQIIIFGEHAVVHGKKAVAAVVDLRTFVEILPGIPSLFLLSVSHSFSTLTQPHPSHPWLVWTAEDDRVTVEFQKPKQRTVSWPVSEIRGLAEKAGSMCPAWGAACVRILP